MSYLKKYGMLNKNTKVKRKGLPPLSDEDLPPDLPELVNPSEDEFLVIVKKQGKLNWRQRRLLKKYPESTFLVEMFFSNGTSREFIIRSKKETFKFKKRMYYLRYQDIIFSTTHSLYKLIFHEDIFVPINPMDTNKREKQVDEAGEEIPIDDPRRRAWWNVTPHNAEEFFNMEYVKVLAQAIKLTKYIMLVLLVLIFLSVIELGLGAMVYQVYQIIKGGAPV